MRALSLAVAFVVLPLPALADGMVRIDLTLSPRAMAELASLSEMVTVSAFYFGEPAPGATIEPDEMGQVFLGAEDHTVWPLPQAVVLGANLGAMPRGQVVAPMLNVNVFSARFAHEDNLLDCGLVDGAVADLVGAVQKVHCKLIVE